MDVSLTAIEARILGVLIEKQMTTPDYYPLTLNALVNACNQKTNREPVMDLDATAVQDTIRELQKKRLIWQIKAQGSRALKYEHHMQHLADFGESELSILCMLMLRGPQTAGELRARTSRMTPFHGIAAAEHILKKLIHHDKGPFVLRLDRRPGHKENRYTHLFCDLPAPSTNDAERVNVPAEPPGEDRLTALEAKFADLTAEMEELKRQFESFKSQFE